MATPADSYLIEALAGAGPELHVPQGWPLAVQGDRSTTAYVVLAGTLVVSRDGQEVGRIGPGELAGELGLLRNQPRNATLVAATPVRVMALDRDTFQAHRRTTPALRDHLERTHSIR